MSSSTGGLHTTTTPLTPPHPHHHHQYIYQQNYPPLHQVPLEDLLAGTGQFKGLQQSIRTTFMLLVQAAQQQARELAQLQTQVQQQNDTSAVSMRTIRTLMEGHVEALRSEVAPKLRSLEARLEDVTSRVEGLEQQQQRPQQRQQRRGGSGRGGEEEGDLTYRLESLQTEVARVKESVEGKADNEEVKMALQQRVSKTSLPKRVQAIMQEQQQQNTQQLHPSIAAYQSSLQRLKARLETYERKHGDQEEALRRVLVELDLVKTHVLGGDGIDGDKDSITTIMKNLQALLQQQGRKQSRTEKDLAQLQEKVIKELATLETKMDERLALLRPQQYQLHGQSMTSSAAAAGGGGGGGGISGGGSSLVLMEDHLKALEQDIVKELDVRDGDIRRHFEETMGALREVEAKTDNVAGEQAGQRVELSQRMDRLEQQLLHAQAQVPLQGGARTATRARGRERETVSSTLNMASSISSIGGGGGGGGAGMARPSPATITQSSFEPGTPDPTRPFQNIRHVFHGAAPAPPVQQQQGRYVGAGGGGGGGGGSTKQTTLPPRPTTPSRTSHGVFPSYPSQSVASPYPHTHMQHPAPPPIPPSALPPPPHQHQHQQQHQQQQHQAQASHVFSPRDDDSGHHGHFFSQPAPSINDGDQNRTASSFLGGGGMPTEWRGTVQSPIMRTAATQMESSTSSLQQGEQQQQQLETLRKEKEMLRTRIREGLSGSQGS